MERHVLILRLVISVYNNPRTVGVPWSDRYSPEDTPKDYHDVDPCQDREFVNVFRYRYDRNRWTENGKPNTTRIYITFYIFTAHTPAANGTAVILPVVVSLLVVGHP